MAPLPTVNKVLDKFVHRPGVHCESSALRDVFEYNGLALSEAMVFGLGSGLGFVYWQQKDMPFPFVGGRSRTFVEDLCHNLGIEFKAFETGSAGRALDALRQLITRDKPVIINVDMPYLRYLGLPAEAHFGGHMVVVAGIEEDKGVAYVADTAFERLQTVTLKELEEARGSDTKIFPPGNRWWAFRFPPQFAADQEISRLWLPRAIATALSKTARGMLNPRINNLGTAGILHFATKVLQWPEEFPVNVYGQQYRTAYTMLNEDGTGGGLFRFLYASFLKEAGESLKDPELLDIAREYHGVGSKWAVAARQIRGIPEGGVMQVGETSRILYQIAEAEEGILRVLEEKGKVMLSAFGGHPK
jgi:hypothetical protein